MPLETTPPSEARNVLTEGLDELDAVGFVRALRAVDSQIFAGYKSYAGLLDDEVLATAERTVQASAAVLRQKNGSICLTGCGTSGRVAFLTARRFNLFKPGAFSYLISGGDAAIVLSDELPEDDPAAGAAQLAQLREQHPAISLIGISCGLSAPYVAGQLDHALAYPLQLTGLAEQNAGAGFAAAALGFNPSRLSRPAPISGLRFGGSFRELVSAFHEAVKGGSAMHAVIDPVVGPEAIAGSSRMKGGSATLALCDAICYRALKCCEGAKDVPTLFELLSLAEGATRATYARPSALASVAEVAGIAVTQPAGRLFYLGEGVAGLLGVIDASEMPDTYGVPFDTVRAFVGGGWEVMGNREGAAMGKENALLRLSIDNFVEDVLPTVGPSDSVIIIGCGAEPGAATGESGLPGTRIFDLIPKLRSRRIGNIGLVCAASETDISAFSQLLSTLQSAPDAVCLVPLPKAGFTAGHGGLAELSLKLCLNVITTYAMTARGLVFSNRMISTAPTNDKIYTRCVAMIAELIGVNLHEAKVALLRSIYKKDELPPSILNAETRKHIVAATPTGDGQLRQQVVLPVALLLASKAFPTVAEATMALRDEPRVSALIARIRGSRAVPAVAPASVPCSSSERTLQLGIDLGTTSIKVALVDVKNDVTGPGLHRSSAYGATSLTLVGEVVRSQLGSDRSFAAITAQISDVARRVVSASGRDWNEIAAVGVSQPGHIDPSTGRIAAAANLPWEDAPLREALASALCKRTTILEDADAAMLAELCHGGAAVAPSQAAGASHTAMLLVLGGGVGSSLAIDGRIHRGSRGLIEAGHMIMEQNGRDCGCGQQGCLEAYASASAIVLRAQELSQSKSSDSPPFLDARDVATKAADNADAKAAMDEAVAALGTACINICRIVDPHVLVFGGGVATPELLKSVEAHMRSKAWTILTDPVQFKLASRGADAGVLGAAAAAARAATAASEVSAAPADNATATPDGFTVRLAMPSDRAAAFRVCLVTGDEGADATSLYKTDPDALGKRWVGPYLDLQPNLAFVLQDPSGRVVGYCLAALESKRFAQQLRNDYLPPLQALHADPAKAVPPVDEAQWTLEQRVYHELHDPAAGEPPAGMNLSQYPSHLHIDLAPEAQGYGQGRRMMLTMLTALREQGSAGAYLQMHEANTRARRFYAKLGFEELSLGGGGEAGSGGDFYLGIRFR